MKPLDLDEIIARIAEGEHVYQIAPEVGMSVSGLRARLKREAGEKYQRALEFALESELVEGIMRADEALANADSPMALVAASRLGKSIRHRYRRRPPRFTVSMKKAP